MNFRIVEKEAFKLVGFKKRVPIIFNGVNPEIAKMYGRLTPTVIEQLKALSDIEPIGPFPETLQNVWGRIYSEWFPASGYETVEGPEILWNESNNKFLIVWG